MHDNTIPDPNDYGDRLSYLEAMEEWYGQERTRQRKQDVLMIDRLGDMTERCYRAEGVARYLLRLLKHQQYCFGLNYASTKDMERLVAENEWLEETA